MVTKKLVGQVTTDEKKEIQTFNHADHIAQLSRDHPHRKRTFGIAD